MWTYNTPRDAKKTTLDILLGGAKVVAGIGLIYLTSRYAPEVYQGLQSLEHQITPAQAAEVTTASAIAAVYGAAKLITHGAATVFNRRHVPKHENDYAHTPLYEMLKSYVPRWTGQKARV